MVLQDLISRSLCRAGRCKSKWLASSSTARSCRGHSLFVLLLAYKCLHGTAPSYLREMLKEYVPPPILRSTSKNLLSEPRTKMKTYGDRSFSACAPKLCNQLPNNIRAAGSVAICSKTYISINYVDININPLTM